MLAVELRDEDRLDCLGVKARRARSSLVRGPWAKLISYSKRGRDVN